MDESEKTLKIGFRPRPMSRKQQKERFGHSRKTKNGENCISATAETEKMTKIGFLALREMQKQPQNSFLALRETQKHLQNGFLALREMQKQPQNGFTALRET